MWPAGAEPKVLVLAVGGLHLGYVGCYGNDWVRTPALDRLAAEGVVFDLHFADSLGVAPPTWRTGRYHFPSPDAAGPASADLDALLRAHGVGVHADPDALAEDGR